MAEKQYFLGVDNGTQSTKTIVVDGETGQVLAKATKAYGLIEGLPPGYKEQDPTVWIDALLETMNQALLEAKIDTRKVRAIGVSGQQHGLVPLDQGGRVIRPVKLWNDTSTLEECRILTRRLGGVKSVINYLGLTIPPGYTASKVLWLKRHEPANFDTMNTILLPHDYLNFYLTGKRVMEYGDASGTALMDVRTRRWSKEVLDAVDPNLRSKLPPVQSSDKPAGIVRDEITARFRFGKGVLVSAGGGDNMMGAVGTGNTREGIVTASLGTSGTIYAYSKSPIVDPEGEIPAFCDSTNAWLPLLCTMNVTVATEYVRNMFKLSYGELSDAVEKAPAGSDGLVLLPYFEGERTPNVPDGTGVFYGVNSRTFDARHFARAAMEGVTLGMNYGLNRMRSLGIKPTQIRLTGGGSKNAAWRQIAADVFDAEVVCLGTDEGAAYGAALQAIWMYKKMNGEKTSIQEITDRYVKVDEGTLTRQKPADVEVYRELQRIQDSVSLYLKKTFARHRRFLTEHVA